MKYMSEITGKTYDTIEDCEAAEKAIVESKEAAVQRKKELCAKIKEAEKKVTDAQEADKVVREEVLKEFEALKARLQESRKAIIDADKEKCELMSAFAKECGRSYQTNWDEASINEHADAVQFLQNVADSFWNAFPFIIF